MSTPTIFETSRNKHPRPWTSRIRAPRTGERIAIGPSAGVSFKAAKALKDALT